MIRLLGFDPDQAVWVGSGSDFLVWIQIWLFEFRIKIRLHGLDPGPAVWVVDLDPALGWIRIWLFGFDPDQDVWSGSGSGSLGCRSRSDFMG